MTYKFDGFHGRALYELNGLPVDVRDGPLVERLLQLLKDPWETVPEGPGLSAVRVAFFGAKNQGMLTFIVHEQTETLRIIDVLWVG